MTSEDTTFFVTVAQVASTLLGLTFIALSFFLVDVLKRYEGSAFPAYRHRERNNTSPPKRKHWRPEHLTDYELMDGDPLVVFIAFSVAVTWNLFLMPMTIGLTAAWGVGLGALGCEMAIFFAFFWFSFEVRNEKIYRLKPYLTREELLWRPLGRLALVLYLSATILVVAIALSEYGFEWRQLTSIWTRRGILSDRLAVLLLKTSCLSSLLLGTYAVNKDMFIFFKSVATERMRMKWLECFLADTYPKLRSEVQSALSADTGAAKDELRKVWHDGIPKTVSTHEVVQKATDDGVSILWSNLLGGHSAMLGWMLDVPSIALWEEKVREALDSSHSELAGCETATRELVMPQADNGDNTGFESVQDPAVRSSP